MKKILLFSALAVLIFSFGCSKEESEKSCWEFTITTVTSISGVSVPGYPQTTTTKREQCGLTESEAQEVVDSLTSTTTATVSGTTATVKITATKIKK